MPLTPTQLKDLKTYKATINLGFTPELGSLSGILIDDIFEIVYPEKTPQEFMDIPARHMKRALFSFETKDEKICFILQNLSRKDGKAVMPFLDVEVKTTYYFNDFSNYDRAIEEYFGSPNELILLFPQTLDHLLYHQFTDALRVGKDFDEALGIITKTYLNEVYSKEN